MVDYPELPNRLWNGHQLESEAEVELEGPDIVVTLPGGCHLTQPKFDRFKLFQENPNTRRWLITSHINLTIIHFLKNLIYFHLRPLRAIE